jgi:hypothetical protein
MTASSASLGPLCRAEQTSLAHTASSGFDPKRTSVEGNPSEAASCQCQHLDGPSKADWPVHKWENLDSPVDELLDVFCS